MSTTHHGALDHCGWKDSCDAVVPFFSAADITASEKADESKSFVGKLIATLLRNLEIRIENYHFRYEDKELFPGKITTLGLMLKEFLVKAGPKPV